MARVIKAGAGQRGPARPPTRVVIDAGQKRLIGRELYQAKQDAEHILMRAEQSRQVRIAEGKRQAAQAREEAMTRGASEAFAFAAAEALAAFRKRAERYAEAAEDIRALAMELVKKVLGNDPDLAAKDVDAILSRGLAQLRARRRLRLQVSESRLELLAAERPNLMKALVSEPDLVVEAADDVGEGFARVVTEVGGALCAEDTALDELASAVNVLEKPRKGARPGAVVSTQVGARPSERALESARRRAVEDLPQARVEDEHDASDVESTIDLRSEKKKPPRNDPVSDEGENLEEIEAEEDDSRTAPRQQRRVPTGRVMAAPRPATRVVPIASASPSSEADDEMELFTDEAVPPKKRR